MINIVTGACIYSVGIEGGRFGQEEYGTRYWEVQP